MDRGRITFEDILLVPDHGPKKVLAAKALFVLGTPGYMSNGSVQPLRAYAAYRPYAEYARTMVLADAVDFARTEGEWKKLSPSKRRALTEDLDASMAVARRQAKQIDARMKQGYCGK